MSQPLRPGSPWPSLLSRLLPVLGADGGLHAGNDLLELGVGVNVSVAAILGVEHLSLAVHLELAAGVGCGFSSHGHFVPKVLFQVRFDLAELGGVTSSAAKEDK